MMSAFSHSQPTLTRLFNNCIKSYKLDYIFLKYVEEEGVKLPLQKKYPQKAQPY